MIKVRAMVFNGTLKKIQLYGGSPFYWRKPSH